jgi:hypothetical protein
MGVVTAMYFGKLRMYDNTVVMQGKVEYAIEYAKYAIICYGIRHAAMNGWMDGCMGALPCDPACKAG